jgi:hypothetical protein
LFIVQLGNVEAVIEEAWTFLAMLIRGQPLTPSLVDYEQDLHQLEAKLEEFGYPVARLEEFKAFGRKG